MADSHAENLYYHYFFELPDGRKQDFRVELDGNDLSLVSPKPGEAQPWADLDYNQCPNCPLSKSEYEHCPVALNLTSIVDFFGAFFSYEKALVTVQTESRAYTKEGPLQVALSSLIGIVMVSSGCPVLDKLRPMVRLHLPFATARENVIRVISMYLLAQYFRKRQNQKPNWDISEIDKIYEEINKLDIAFTKRMASAFDADANVNAVVVLSCIAELTRHSLKSNLLDQIEGTFAPYLDQPI